MAVGFLTNTVWWFGFVLGYRGFLIRFCSLKGPILGFTIPHFRNSGICGMDTDYYSALDRLRDTIPDFDCSGFTNKDTAPPKSQKTLASALFSKIVKSMEVDFDMTFTQKAVFECLRAPHAQDFLLAIPIDGLGQHMSPVEYRTILRYRLMIPLFPVDEICSVCRKACLDSFGEHAVHCRELPGFKYRHDMVSDVLFDVCWRAEISIKKEVASAACKVDKHEKTCIENQHVFIPFAFDTFGFLAPETVELLNRVQQMHDEDVDEMIQDKSFEGPLALVSKEYTLVEERSFVEDEYEVVVYKGDGEDSKVQ
ncbi:hypothetical protein L1887_21559 [Cichorium endivia]|nr:hypothetical protein L1887_21559 [Cichorium endivia]